MPLLSLSTLSFKLPKDTSVALRRSAVTGLWALFFLGVFDVAVNRLFHCPTDPTATCSSKLGTYFEYGRSVEGKLDRMVGATDDKTSSVALAGWLEPERWQKLPTRPEQGAKHLVAVYGQSFALDVADDLKKLDPKITLRKIAGPSAPPNYAYAAYQLDRGRQQADIVVLGVLASSIKGMTAMNGMTWQFEGPAPFTYPRYVLDNGTLKTIKPTIQTLEQFRAARNNPTQWDAFTQQLRENDRYYDDFLFRQNWFDNSVIVRMVRRSLAQQHQTAIANQIHSSTGYTDDVTIQTLQAITTEFAQTAKADGKLPVVLLLQDKGYNDHLYKALQPALEKNAIPYISTHAIAPATDLKNFVSDGHFTPAANEKISQALLDLINDKAPKPKLVNQPNSQ